MLGLSFYCYANDDCSKRKRRKYCSCCYIKNSKITPYSNSAQKQTQTYYPNREIFNKNKLPPIPKNRHLNNTIYDSNQRRSISDDVLYNDYSPKYETVNEYNQYNHLDTTRSNNHYNHLDTIRRNNNYNNSETNKNNNLNIEYNNFQSRNNNSSSNLYDEVIDYNNSRTSSFIYYSNPNNSSSRQALPNNIYG